MGLVANNCKLEKRRVTLQYSDSYSNPKEIREEQYEILVFQSRPRALVKTDRSGKVFLDKWKNWKDSQAWINITYSPGRDLLHETLGDAGRKI